MFLINFFGAISLQMIANFLSIMFAVFPVSEDVCFQYYALLITNMVFCFGIISMQLDKVIAIFWDVHYKAWVTTSRAMKMCGLNIVMATIIGILMGFIDREYGKCTNKPSLIYTRTTYIILIGILKIVTVVVVAVASFYFVRKTKQIVNSIHPANKLTNQPRPTQKTVSRINSQPDMFFIMEPHNRELSEEAGTSQQNGTVEEEETFGCYNQTELVLMLKNTNTMNILTMVLLVLGILPHVILGMIYHNCSEETGDCEHFVYFYKICIPVRAVGLIILDLVVLKRLHKVE